MRLASTKSIKSGTRLAQTIYNDSGQALVQKGIDLTERMLDRLTSLGITYVYIEDELTDDILVSSVIPEELRIKAIKTVKETFMEIKTNGIRGRLFLSQQTGDNMANIVQMILDEMQNKKDSLSMLSDIFATDDYTFQHSLNVTIYSIAIGIGLKMPKKEMLQLGIGAMLHDVGKVFIDQDILQKAAPLSDEEFEVIQSHTQLGFDFLRKHSDIPLVAAHCAFQHHERLDGSGYPRGIGRNDIHKYAKIIGIADVFDAVTSNRVYRDAMLPHEGLEMLYAGAVHLFEKQMVEAFQKRVAVYPNGLVVELSDGRSGVVVKQHNSLCDRPIIRIFNEGKEKISPHDIDLSKVMDIMIVSCRIDR